MSRSVAKTAGSKPPATLENVIDERLAAGPFSGSTNIYSAARGIAVGDVLTAAEFAAELRKSGYTASAQSPEGWFKVRDNAVEVMTGPDPAPGTGPVVVEFAHGKVARITS